MMHEEKAAAERELTGYREVVDRRDDMVRRAHGAGVSKHRIFVLTGISRSTIDRILEKEQNVPIEDRRRPRSRGYDVDWTDESNPRIVPAEPGDQFAMTRTEAEQSIRDQQAEEN